MKILMFGRGTITTQYGWVFEKAGHQVEFYVRPGRAAQFGPTVELDLIDARGGGKGKLVQEAWPVTLREELNADHDYDLIIVSVNLGAFPEAAKVLGPRVGKATVLVFNNLWTDARSSISALPEDHVVWGFPGAGGGFNKDGVLRGAFLKSVFFGTLGNALTERDKAVRALFKSSGFSVSEQKNFGDWLLHHYALDAAVGVALNQAGSVEALTASTKNLAVMVHTMRELLPLLRARGVRLALAAWLPFQLPAGLLAFALKGLMAPGSLAREILDRGMASTATSGEMKIYPRDVLAEARRLGIRVPRLEAAEALFR